MELTIQPGHLSLADLRNVSRHSVKIQLDDSCHKVIQASVDCVNRVIHEHRVVYGINTGLWPAGQHPYCRRRSGASPEISGTLPLHRCGTVYG